MRFSLAAAGVLACLLIAAPAARAQQRSLLPPTMDPPPPPDSPPVTVVAGPEYRAGQNERMLLGSVYRGLWTAPITVRVLNPSRYRGGLYPVRAGGGFQTITLHLRDGQGRYYLFRSINKLVNQGLGPDLRATPVGWVIQDQTKSVHPAAAWAITPILDAVGIRVPAPELYVMGDDPALGEFREEFAGMLGMLVESPDDGPDHTLRFQGSDRVLGSEELLEVLAQSPMHRVDARTFLTARMVDLLVGDSDRGFAQWRWLGYRTDFGWMWEPSPLDRDAAFLMGDGLVATVVRTFLPKYVRFDGSIHVKGLTSDQPEPDLLLLSELDRATWDSIVASVQAAVTDDVIARGVAELPSTYRALSDTFLARVMVARRAQLPKAADELYRRLARDVDVQGTEADETARIQRNPDGSVTVDLYGPPGEIPFAPPGDGSIQERAYFHRRFVPDETKEVRVYLRGGADLAVVRGSGSEIAVRVIGGPGDDVLIDSTYASSDTHFYDAEGDNRFLGPAGADVNRHPWWPVAWSEYQFERDKLGRDFGYSRAWRPRAEREPGPGLIVGVGRRWQDYGFRRLPYAQRLDAYGLFGVQNAGLGGELDYKNWREDSRLGYHLSLHGLWKLWGVRFHGLGNDVIEQDSSTTSGDEVVGGAYLRVALGDRGADGTLSIGPEVRWTNPDAIPGSPLAAEQPLGWDSFGAAALAADLEFEHTDRTDMPHSGFWAVAHSSVSPPLWDAPSWFGGTVAHTKTYLPIGPTTLVVRAGGGWAWGDYPFQSAAYEGGRWTVRGYDYNQFAGDAALDGGLEWQMPLTRLTLITRGDLGLMGLVDTGRVWLDGDSDGGWHTGIGGGVWYRSLGAAASLTVVQGRSTKIYVAFRAPTRLTNLVNHQYSR